MSYFDDNEHRIVNGPQPGHGRRTATDIMSARNSNEKESVMWAGKEMGFGRLMQLAEECWREIAISKGLHGSELTVGTCAAFLVPCPHTIKDDHGHCDICCGSGRITKGVFELLSEKRNA